MRLANKVCFVTGGNRGIGKAIAQAFDREGAEVAFSFNTHSEEADETAKSMPLSLGPFWLDLRDVEEIEHVFHLIDHQWGPIEVLVNNAGINRPADFDQQTEREWAEVLDVNLTGTFLCCQKVLKYMPDGGRIINIGSLSGEYGGPRTPSYACAKAGVMALTHCLARFVGPRNICVNCISPGIIENEFTAQTMAPSVRELIDHLLLIQRPGTYADLTGLAVFLASDESSYITGQTISVNGGAWVR